MADRISAIVDGAARVIAGAVAGRIYAAGATVAVTGAQPLVVPLADDFLEASDPAVTVAMGPWDTRAQPTNERMHIELLCVVWRARAVIGDTVPALYADREAVADTWIAHSKAYLVDASLQSALLKQGPGIVPRELGDPMAQRLYLTLPFTVEVVCNRNVLFLPA